MVALVSDGTLNNKTARIVLEETLTTGKAPAAIVKERGLSKIADPARTVVVLNAAALLASFNFVSGRGAVWSPLPVAASAATVANSEQGVRS